LEKLVRKQFTKIFRYAKKFETVIPGLLSDDEYL